MAINGLLMFGWSAAFLFLISQKTWQDMLSSSSILDRTPILWMNRG
jgi:hypothetical protein